MIHYGLLCGHEHAFEGWFADSAAFDAQAAQGLLHCPVCGDPAIRKGIMAPAVKTSITKAKGKSEPVPSPDAQGLRQFAAGFRKYVKENADDVGPRFPEEARKIHYGEIEHRQIYGESSLEEAKELVEEGIDILPLPPDPDGMN